MNIIFSSIKGRLFIWSFFCNSILLLVISLIMYSQIKVSIFMSVDNILHSKLETINNMFEIDKKQIKLELTDFVSGEYTILGSGHYYKVMIDNKKIIISPSLITKNYNFSSGNIELDNKKLKETTYTSTLPNHEKIRVLKKAILFSNIPITIFVAENIEESTEIIENLDKIIFIVFPLAIIIFGIITFWITKISLKPLDDFSNEVRLISHKNLDKKINIESKASELKDLVLSFNDMLNRIKNAFDIEKFIISEASHKLKTPVTLIKGYCDLILQKERDKSEYIDTLGSIRRVSRNISNLINGILSIANLDSGHFLFQSYESISINKCLKNAVDLSNYIATKKQISFELFFDQDVTILGDEDKLTEAFINIIENAIKYNKENGFIKIKTSQEADKVIILIEDSGIGIKEDEINKVFERFYRSNSVRKIEGSGLGLNIAKIIIEAHNGNVTVESELNIGTKFKIVLKI